MKKARGIYGLRCPISGAIRYIGKSKDIERRYIDHCERPFIDQGGGWAKRTWVLDLRRIGLRPSLVILQEITRGEMREAEALFIATYELLGEADLNIQQTAKCDSVRVGRKLRERAE